MNKLLLSASLATFAIGFGSAPALAASAENAPPPPPRAHGEDASDDHDIIVTGHPPVDFGLLAATASIEGDKLVAETRGQIGEILASLPGVSATSFAPGASRPVLRGLGSERVAVLLDGIGSVDASNVSADHAVVFDPLTVDHIDVHHGPAVLLFGGNAIGGAINALDRRIPRSVPEHIGGTAIATYGTAADERAFSGALEIPLADRVALHLDGNWRKSDDLRVGGFVASAPLRAEILADAAVHAEHGEAEEAAELGELANRRGRLPNSAARSTTLGAGLAFIDAGGDLGISVQHFDTLYGVPMRPGAGHGHDDAGEDEGGEAHEDEGPVRIDLKQLRLDLRGSLKLGGVMGGAFEAVQFRGAYGDYSHVELEGDEVGTRFDSKGIEVRSDLIQADRKGWRGRSGVQYFSRTMAIAGAEAFTPDYEVERVGFFTLQAVKLGAGIELEGAGRYERSSVRARSIGFARDFSLWSGAAGLSWSSSPLWKIGLNYLHGARAPSPEELLSDGLHVATQSYELGDPGFTVETSDGLEAYIKYTGKTVQASLTAYATDFDDFIVASPNGEERGGFPVFAYSQQAARFRGFEVAASATALRWQGGDLAFDASADYTHARLAGSGAVPRIPPLRLRGGAQLRQGALRVRGEVEWNARQGRVAAFEEPVAAFTLVNLSVDWHPLGEEGPVTLILDAENLLDVTARRAASLTRDFVPLAGRDVRLTAKVSF
ncbi:MAG TPA: TonB-dependent receptor [Novosphingobium sp.]|nr:TonB-dependent receptor [Novosphingobium sp.]